MSTFFSTKKRRNTTEVFGKTLEFLKIAISKETKQRLYDSLNDSSISSLKNALAELNIDTLVAKIGKEQLQSIPLPAILSLTNYNNHFCLCTSFENDNITYYNMYDGWQTESINDFNDKWSGICLLFELTQNTGDDNYKLNKRISIYNKIRLFLTGFIITLILAIQNYLYTSNTFIIIEILFVIGFIICSLLVATDLDSKISERFCSINEKVDCANVLDSPAAILFGWLKVSEVGLIWYATMILLCVIASISRNVQNVLPGIAILSTAAVFYAPFSILYQWIKIKKWCPLCLGIQLILICVAIILHRQLYTVSIFINSKSAQFSICIAFLASTVIWLYLKPLILKTRNYEHDAILFQEIKRDNQLFEFFFKDQVKYDIKQLYNCGQNNVNSRMVLTFILNPGCKPCAKIHNRFENLTKGKKQDIEIKYVFMVYDTSATSENYKIATHILSLPENIQQFAVSAWFESKDYHEVAKLFPTEISKSAQEILIKQNNWLKMSKILSTPTLLLDNKVVSSYYSIDDVLYHILNTKKQTR